MLTWILFLGALAHSSATLLEKIILREKKINSKHFLITIFSFSVLVMLPFIYFFGKVEFQAFELKNILLFITMIILAILANATTFFALKWEKINNIQPIRLLEPIFAIFIAFLIFESERNIHFLIPAIIASIALLASHIRKHHLVFNKYAIAAIFGSLFYAIEVMFSKVLLEFYSPLSLYFFRGIFIAFFAFLIFRPKNIRKEIGKKERGAIFITAILWVTYRVISYFGYQNWGVVFTTLILLIAPIFLYIFARIFLKEKILKRNIIATIIIVICVAYANFYKFLF